MSTKSLVLLIVLSGLLSSCVTTTEKGTGKIDDRVMWYERIWEMGEPITGSKIVDSCRSIKECEDNTEPKTPRDGVTNLSSQCADTIAASKCIGAIHSFEKLEDRSYSELMSLRDFIGFFVNWSANHQERLQRTWSEAVRLAFYDSWNVSSDQSLKKSISSQSDSKAKDIIYKSLEKLSDEELCGEITNKTFTGTQSVCIRGGCLEWSERIVTKSDYEKVFLNRYDSLDWCANITDSTKPAIEVNECKVRMNNRFEKCSLKEIGRVANSTFFTLVQIERSDATYGFYTEGVGILVVSSDTGDQGMITYKGFCSGNNRRFWCKTNVGSIQLDIEW